MSGISTQSPKVGLVSLGCPKTLVDSERIITQLHAEGYETPSTYGGAGLIVVNTCGLINEAVQEDLDAVGETLTENDKMAVTGCLGAKKDATGQDIITSVHPKALAVTGPHVLDEVMGTMHTRLPKPYDPFIDLVPLQGIRSTSKHYAYLKISKGYDHRCSFCIIPSMRGDLASRPVTEAMLEAENLLKIGVEELLVILRDTSVYGVDVEFRMGFWNGRSLKMRMTEPVGALGELASQYGTWMCLHYAYSYPSVDEMTPLMTENKVLPYLDAPSQHAHPDTSKRMKRPANAKKTLDRIRAWYEACSELTIHSMFIVGFLGETEEEFQALFDFIAEAELGRAGCFAHSPIEGTVTNDLPGALLDEVCEERCARFIEVAERMPAHHLQRKIGKPLRMLVDEVNQGGSIDRSSTNAPETDGLVYIAPPSKLYKRYKTDDSVSVKITGADGHDLWGEI